MKLYTESTTKLYTSLDRFSWAMRDRKMAEARYRLAEMKSCVEALDRHVNPRPGILARIEAYLAGGK